MYALEADVSRMRDGRVTNSETQSMAMVLLSTMLSLQEKHRDIQISRLVKLLQTDTTSLMASNVHIKVYVENMHEALH